MSRLTLWIALTLASCAHHDLRAPAASRVVAHVLRLHPGDDLKASLLAWRETHDIGAAAVVSCAGSLTTASLRFADQPEAVALPGPWEIVGLSGTLSPDGAHLHLAVSDATGRTVGGHLGAGSLVYTTAEIVVAELPDLAFRRVTDPETTWPELQVEPAP